MCRTPTVRHLCSLLAAGWLAAGAPQVSAAAIAVALPGAPAANTAAGTVTSPATIPAVGTAAAQAAPASHSAPRGVPASPAHAAAAHTATAHAAPATTFDAPDQPEPPLLVAENSFIQVYLTPASFSKAQANDSNASRLHLPRQDPDLEAIDPYQHHPASADEGINPAVLWISILGLTTAAISGILQYARNPITRKRKYRNYDRAAP